MALRRWPQRPGMQGLSLIELIVVVLIIGVLSAMAYPAYVQHLARRDRLAAIQWLYETQLHMERYFAINGRYSFDSAGLTAPPLPARLQTWPDSSYSLDVQASLLGYTLTVTPARVGAQAAWCDQLSLRLSQSGAKTALGLDGQAHTAAEVAGCWR